MRIIVSGVGFMMECGTLDINSTMVICELSIIQKCSAKASQGRRGLCIE
jgi:hypothetical protein